SSPTAGNPFTRRPSRSSTSWTAPAAGTRSAPGSSCPGWTRSRRTRRWSTAAGWPPGPVRWSARGLRSDGFILNPLAACPLLSGMMTAVPTDSASGFLPALFGLAGRTALVTGGSSGIGQAMAGALARAGAQVVVLARGAAAVASTVETLRSDGCQAAWVQADLASVARGAAAAVAHFGEPDIVVNSAGVNLRPPLAELSEPDWDTTIAV